MLTFKEFQEKADYLTYREQKECYEWYLFGCQQGWAECITSDDMPSSHYYDKAREYLAEVKNEKEN